MASFNKKHKVGAATSQPAAVRKISHAVEDTTNLAGGRAFSLTPRYQLAFAALTTFLDAKYYQTRGQQVTDIQTQIKQLKDPLFVAKTAVYARTEYGMRSVSHLMSAEIAKNVKGETWTKIFFDKVVYRVDDAAEILAAYLALHGKPVPNSLKKGLGKSLSKFSSHQLAKYKGEGKGVKLVDLFNLVHPKPSEKSAKAYADLMTGDLASTGTWESKLSAAGQLAETEEEKEELKAGAWKELITTGKIGYFALLRNLRNILDQCDELTIEAACELLVDVKRIEGSLVLPFRYLTAYCEISKLPGSKSQRRVLQAINQATEISLRNVPVFGGDTLVVLDRSGSMGGFTDPKSAMAIGSLFAAAIAKSNNADFMLFDNSTKMLSYSPSDSLSNIIEVVKKNVTSNGTDFRCIFRDATQKYDRIIILSDMQGWMGGYSPVKEFGAYCAKYKASPKVYSFDLRGYGTLQFPQEHVYTLAGFSDKTLDLMKVLEEDPNALIKKINAVSLD